MIRQLRLGDVDIFRRIRLESLQTDPQAFSSTAKDWESLPEAEWARRMTASNPYAMRLEAMFFRSRVFTLIHAD